MGVQGKHALAVKRFRLLAAALAKIGDGQAMKDANTEIQRVMQKVVDSKLPAHKRSGHAESIVKAYPDARGVAMKMPKYLRYQGERRKDKEARLAADKEAKKNAPEQGLLSRLIHGKAEAPAKTKGKPNWWPFARGIPLTLKVRAAKIYAEQLKKTLEEANR